METLVSYVWFFVAVLVALTVHESAHALVAYYLGDPTGKIEGRISLNPMRHIDVAGAIMFVLLGFGWGKPVPVDARNFANPVSGSAYTALAGPASNFILAFALALPLGRLHGFMPQDLFDFLYVLFSVNLVLGAFNLLPLPPLDGSNILGLFVPKRFLGQYVNFLENGAVYSIALILFDILILDKFLNFSIIGSYIGFVHSYVGAALLLGT